ncbi:hypothetical protein EMCRGX_G006683 [Ephydatia muelleri]
MMEFENQTVAGRLLNSSADDHSTEEVYVAIGIIYLVIVVIPSLVIVPVVLYYIYRIVKESGVKPVIFLYAVVAVLCITVTVTCSVLTCLKTKNSMVSATGNSAVRSVVVLNTINITCYVALIVPGLVVYLMGVKLHVTELSQETLDQLVVIGQYIGDVSYPLTALSILILHSEIRRVAFRCCKKTATTTSSSAANITSSIL